MEVPELVDAGVRDVGVVVVHHRRALEVTGIEHLGLEIEVCASRAGPRSSRSSDPAARCRRLARPGSRPAGRRGRRTSPCPAALRSSRRRPSSQPRGVPVDGQPLVGVVEVAVVEVVAHRQPGDAAGGQLGGVGLPLLGGVVLEKRLVQRPADQADRLSSKFWASAVSISPACSAISARASSGL